MGTRYDIGDKVKLEENPEATYMVENIYEPTSDSPTYRIEIEEGEPQKSMGSPIVAHEVKASDIKLDDPVDIDADVRARDSDSIAKAQRELEENFEEFMRDNEQFHFEKVVADDDGYRAVVMVDWGIAENTDGYAMANVLARKEDQPSQDEEDIHMSEAFYTAQDIIDSAASVLPNAETRTTWDLQDSPEAADGSRPIMIEPDNIR